MSTEAMRIVKYWRSLMGFIESYDGPEAKRLDLWHEAERTRAWALNTMMAARDSRSTLAIRRELRERTPKVPTKTRRGSKMGVVSRWTPEQLRLLQKLRRENRV